MRKAQKQQTEEFVELLGQVHKEIKRAVSSRDILEAQQLLIQCQQGAIELGGLIEKTEGEGFVTIAHLENYCEIVYNVYQGLEAEIGSNPEKFYKHLNTALLVIKNSVHNDIPLRKEVVFFPYKASMWDSLESVYLAAKEDADCDAYCVPIPYYDKNPDGSFGQIHYEGMEYPKNIEVVDWQTYNFEERRPDVIYIHNPYDEYNYVTSVHPRFYSSNLKKYTEELVYIPYFILGEPDPENETDVETIKHFCILPGVLNADKVILQSEAMCQIYINEYIKAVQASGIKVDKEQLKKKYLGLGSPKLDKIKNTKKENLEIPNQWLQLIQKPDGSLKKVVFYNTSVTTLLQHNEKMLEKMKWVFKVFKEQKEEVTLLWRPHPLIKATIESMRPQLWQQYEQMVNDYRKAGWGIYDDTADLNRAIALSDAYYGDSSSVVQLYRQTGKPMLLEQVYISKSDKKFQDVEFENLYEDEKYFWFTAFHFNGLFRMGKSEWKPQFVGAFPNEDLAGFRLYSKIIEYENKLYFTPLRAKEIAIYDKEKNVFYKKSFEELKIGYLSAYSGWNFYDAQLYRDNIYFFPHQRTAVLQYDLKRKKLKGISTWVSKITDRHTLLQPRVFYRTAMKGGRIYAPVSGSNLLECIDLETEQVEIYEIGKKGSTYSDICIAGSNAYICPFDGGEIIEWDILVKKEKKAIAFTEKNNGSIYFQSICKLGGKVYVFPEYFKEVIEIDAGSGEIEKTLENVFHEEYLKNDIFMDLEKPIECKYTFGYELHGKIYAYCYVTRRLTEHGEKRSKSERVSIDCENVKNEEYVKFKRLYVRELFEDRNKLSLENSSYSLDNFLECMLEHGDLKD